MRKIIVSILLIAFFSGCGSKKKISNISKGYEVELEETKNDTKVKEAKVTNETTKEKEAIKETYDREVVENYIFDSTGRVVSATKTTKERGQKDTNKETEGSKADSIAATATASTSAVKKTEKKTEVVSKQMERTGKNPIWNWIGGAVFLVIIGVAVWKLVLKK